MTEQKWAMTLLIKELKDKKMKILLKTKLERD